MVSENPATDEVKTTTAVLILVLVEDGLGDHHGRGRPRVARCLNPCFSGGWSRSLNNEIMDVMGLTLS